MRWRMAQQNQSAADSQFETQMTESINWLNHFERDAGDPTEVAEVVVRSLFDTRPRSRYMIVPTQEQAY